MSAETLNYILGFTNLVVLAFAIWNKVRTPQEDLEKKQAVSETEVQGKAEVLERQVQWQKEANELKFSEMGKRLDEAFALAQNHIHTIDSKVDGLVTAINVMSNKITELSTIINERVPKRPI